MNIEYENEVSYIHSMNYLFFVCLCVGGYSEGYCATRREFVGMREGSVKKERKRDNKTTTVKKNIFFPRNRLFGKCLLGRFIRLDWLVVVVVVVALFHLQHGFVVFPVRAGVRWR